MLNRKVSGAVLRSGCLQQSSAGEDGAEEDSGVLYTLGTSGAGERRGGRADAAWAWADVRGRRLGAGCRDWSGSAGDILPL